jgi:hypothetical protein
MTAAFLLHAAAAGAADVCDSRHMTEGETRTAQDWGNGVARALPRAPASAWCDYGQTHGTHELRMAYSGWGMLGGGESQEPLRDHPCKKALPRSGKALCKATATGCFPTIKTTVLYRKYKRADGGAEKDCAHPGRMDAGKESETWTIDTPEKHMALLAKVSALDPVIKRLEASLDKAHQVEMKALFSPDPLSCNPAKAKLTQPGVIMNEQIKNEGTEWEQLRQTWCIGSNVWPRNKEKVQFSGVPGATLARLQGVEVSISGTPDAVRDLGGRLDSRAILLLLGR